MPTFFARSSSFIVRFPVPETGEGGANRRFSAGLTTWLSQLVSSSPHCKAAVRAVWAAACLAIAGDLCSLPMCLCLGHMGDRNPASKL